MKAVNNDLTSIRKCVLQCICWFKKSHTYYFKLFGKPIDALLRSTKNVFPVEEHQMETIEDVSEGKVLSKMKFILLKIL